VRLVRLTAHRLIAMLPERWHSITREMAKFGIIGVINVLVNFTVFNVLVLTVFANGQLKANVVATAVATTGAYFMNRHWTYRDRPKSALRQEYTLFFFFNLVGLAIELSVLGLAKYGLHINHLIALNAFKAIGVALGTIFRFWAYRTHVFKITDGVDRTDEIFPAASSTRVAQPGLAVPGGEATRAMDPAAARDGATAPGQAARRDSLEDELDHLATAESVEQIAV
jgi:putative flippase GtrA